MTRQQDACGNSFWRRLMRGAQPLIPALILDGLDFVLIEPFDIYFGLIIGIPVGYWMCSKYRMPFLKKLVGAFFAGMYCMFPFTELIPAATIVCCYARFWEDDDALKK